MSNSRCCVCTSRTLWTACSASATLGSCSTPCSSSSFPRPPQLTVLQRTTRTCPPSLASRCGVSSPPGACWCACGMCAVLTMAVWVCTARVAESDAPAHPKQRRSHPRHRSWGKDLHGVRGAADQPGACRTAVACVRACVPLCAHFFAFSTRTCRWTRAQAQFNLDIAAAKTLLATFASMTAGAQTTDDVSDASITHRPSGLHGSGGFGTTGVPGGGVAASTSATGLSTAGMPHVHRG